MAISTPSQRPLYGPGSRSNTSIPDLDGRKCPRGELNPVRGGGEQFTPGPVGNCRHRVPGLVAVWVQEQQKRVLRGRPHSHHLAGRRIPHPGAPAAGRDQRSVRDHQVVVVEIVDDPIVGVGARELPPSAREVLSRAKHSRKARTHRSSGRLFNGATLPSMIGTTPDWWQLGLGNARRALPVMTWGTAVPWMGKPPGRRGTRPV